MIIKDIARTTISVITGLTAGAVAREALETILPEADTANDKFVRTVGVYGIASGVSYASATAAETKFDNMWEAADNFVKTIKTIKEDN